MKSTITSKPMRHGWIIAAVAGILLLGVNASTYAQEYAPRMGINLGSPIQGLTFVNAITDTRRGFRGLVNNQVNTPIDENGWPTQDFQITLADLRNAQGQQVDPNPHVIDITGTYAISFNGIATVGTCCLTNFALRNQAYDPATNTTTLEFFVGEGSQAFLQLKFRDTQRNADAAVNTGITNLRVNRPGYDLSTTQSYTDAWLNAIAPFSTLRYMDWLHTNNNAEFADEAQTQPVVVDWADRKVTLPNERTTGTVDGLRGLAWEEIIAHANYTGKDAWINIPVHASDDYVRQLARLFKNELDPAINVYLEYSNELWNYSFDQFDWNFYRAQEEVAAGSNLNYDGSTNPNLWAARRTAQRLVEIAQIFQNQGVGTVGERLRPVLTWFTAQAGNLAAGGALPTMADMLAYIEENYGTPNQYLHSISRTGYFGARAIDALPEGATVEEILEAAERGIPTDFDEFSALADQYGLKFTAYEGAPGHRVNSTKNIANRIRAERSPRMGELIKRTLVDAWFANDGDLYMYFSTSKYYTRSGFWGLSDDITQLDRGFKNQALLDVINGTNINPAPLISVEKLPGGLEGVAYNQSLTAYSGDAPLRWSVTQGSLPAGLQLDADGRISGTPTTPGAASFTAEVVDADGDRDTRSFDIRIKTPISITATAVAPTVDGTVDPLWNDIPARNLGNVIRGSITGASDCSARFRATWNTDQLYILVEVTDDTLTNDSEGVFNDDGVEVYVDINNDKGTAYGPNDYQIAFRYNDPNVVVNPTGSSVAGIVRAESATGNGYVMEIALPWAALGEDQPQAGTEVGLDVHVADDDDGGNRDAKISWSATEDRSFSDPTTFGTAILAGQGGVQPTGTNITVYAGGRTNTETMELRIDGQAVQQWENVGGSFTGDFVTYTYPAAGSVSASQIQVAFVNDDGANRDLRVDKIEVDGVVYQSEAADTYSTGTWNRSSGCNGGFKRNERLHCNGYLAYAQAGARTTADTSKDSELVKTSAEEVALFPNPTQEILEIRLPAHEGKVVITLIDRLGREVLRHRQPHAHPISLPVRTLTKGLYQVNIRQGGRQTLRKLLVE